MRRGVDVDAQAGGLQRSRAEGDASSPCRWCRRHGSPAAAGARDGRAARAAARSGRARDRCSSDAGRDSRAISVVERRLRGQRTRSRVRRGRRRLGGRSICAGLDDGCTGFDASRAPAPWSAGGSSRASVARSSWRCTTMSTMPCSIRYSARWKPSGSFSRMVCSITRGAGEADQRAGLGDLDVAEHGVGRGDAAGGRVGQHDDVGQPAPRAGVAPRPWCAASASATGCLPACARRRRRRTAMNGDFLSTRELERRRRTPRPPPCRASRP